MSGANPIPLLIFTNVLSTLRCSTAKELSKIYNSASIPTLEEAFTNFHPPNLYSRKKFYLKRAQLAGLQECPSVNLTRRNVRRITRHLGVEIGFKIVQYPRGKGRGIVTTRQFERGEYLLVYPGDLITKQEEFERTAAYADNLDDDVDVYSILMYFDIPYKGRLFTVDGTPEELKGLGRLVNHSRRRPNVGYDYVGVPWSQAERKRQKQLDLDLKLYIVLYAMRRILPGEELLYNYDWDIITPSTVAAYPWIMD